MVSSAVNQPAKTTAKPLSTAHVDDDDDDDTTTNLRSSTRRGKTLHDTVLHPNGESSPQLSRLGKLAQSNTKLHMLNGNRVQPKSQETDSNAGGNTQITQASEDARSLRSRTGGSRLKSDLATYFVNYEDILYGTTQHPGMSDIIAFTTRC
jgi:hypothetical protein